MLGVGDHPASLSLSLSPSASPEAFHYEPIRGFRTRKEREEEERERKKVPLHTRYHSVVLDSYDENEKRERERVRERDTPREREDIKEENEEEERERERENETVSDEGSDISDSSSLSLSPLSSSLSLSPSSLSSLRVGSLSFIPFHCTLHSIYATSRFRREGLIVCRLPVGFIVVSCSKPHRIETIIASVERFCDALRE